jgi:transcriptional regulator with XRE-family HTH domain
MTHVNTFLPQPGITSMDTRFAKNLRIELIEQGWSRKTLSDETGISLSSIHKYCTGERHPKWVQLMKIKNALGCDIGRLV